MKTLRVYCVLHDIASGGPAGDGTGIARFRRKADAEQFAKESSCWGGPARVQTDNVPVRIAQRWTIR